MRSISDSEFLRHAEYRVSVADLRQLPPDDGAEVAFAGRSNSGKSSALNAITGRKTLARVSKTPGRTRLINFFALGDDQALADLPGYGYAAVSAGVKAGWDALLGGYLRDRQALRGVVLVMDIRHPLTELDLQLLDFCAAAGRPVHVLLSKCDKLAHGAQLNALRAVREQLRELAPGFTAQLFSATRREGVEQAQRQVAAWLGHTPAEVTPAQAKKNPGNKGRDSGALK